MADKEKETKQEELKLDPLAEMKAEMKAEMQKILEDANKEAAEIIANAKAQAEAQAEVTLIAPVAKSKEEIEQEKYWNEEVVVELFEDGGKYKDDVPVSVNGKTWVLQRGVPVKVPRFVASVIDNSEKQDKAATQYSKQRQSEYENSLK